MKAHELLATPDRWTKGTFARRLDGTPTLSTNDEAACFCALGALNRCYGESSEERVEAANKLRSQIGPRDSISIWNDAPERTHAEVLAVLKELDI